MVSHLVPWSYEGRTICVAFLTGAFEMGDALLLEYRHTRKGMPVFHISRD